MKSKDDAKSVAKTQPQVSSTGRWIRPVREAPTSDRMHWAAESDVDEVTTALLREARRRVSGLTTLQRELEDKIRDRWEEAEEEIRRRGSSLEEELAASRKSAEAELNDLRAKGERDGRMAGFREGFARSREEGYRLGYEEGRREGLKEGQKEGHEQSSEKLQQEMAGAVSALTHATLKLEEDRARLLLEARRDVLRLSLEVASKLVKREVKKPGDVALRNIEKAVELIFRRGTLAIQVHPVDRPAIEKALEAEPRWAEEFDSIEIRSAAEVEPGGCRLVSGAGMVDMTLATQLGLIEEALGLSDSEKPAETRAVAKPRKAASRKKGGG